MKYQTKSTRAQSIPTPSYANQVNCPVRFMLCAAKAAVLCVPFLCFGCSTQSLWKISPRCAGYSDEEIFSRTWTNRSGRIMQVTESTVEESRHYGTFLISKIGDRQSKESFYCEIFLVKREPARLQVDASRPDLPLKQVKEQNINFLLGRTGLDSDSFTIGGIQMREYANKIVFLIDQRANHQYQANSDGHARGKNLDRMASIWHGGVLRNLILTRNYEANWTYMVYNGPPQVTVGSNKRGQPLEH